MSNKKIKNIYIFLIFGLIFLAGCGLSKNSVQVNKEIGEVREVKDIFLNEDYETRNEDEDDPSVNSVSNENENEEENDEDKEMRDENEDENKDDPSVNSWSNEDENFDLPESFDQKVAFVPQAPFAVWDELHEEACEEAAMIIVAKHLKGEKLDQKIMEEEINKLVIWEKEKLDKWKDTTAEETAKIIQDYFHLSARLLSKPEVEDIKRELVSGNLVIAPTAGQMLDNPYFSGQGPLYHMLVIRGYDQTHFITNDPGTKRGEGFKYTYNNLLGSIHDWNNGEVRKGERVVIVVSRQGVSL